MTSCTAISINTGLALLLLALLVSPGTSNIHKTHDHHQEFGELECNSNAILESEACLTDAVAFSELISSTTSDVVVIPCGNCAYVDYTDGSTVTLPSGGLDVVGRLHFPETANVVIETTNVIVQGMLDMVKPVDGNKVKVSLFGTDEQFAYPHFLCGGTHDEICPHRISMGKKPIAVVGGKLDIQVIDPSCPSWTKLKDGESGSFHVSSNFAACVKSGDELLFTSDTLSHTKDDVGVVQSVEIASADDDAIIVLEDAIVRAIATESGPGEAEYAVEVARLSRDIVFEAQSDDPNDVHGGHLIIFHTPDVIQTIEGVSFLNFGQDGNIGRYPIHFHKSDNSPSLVSKNVVRNSNQRCIVVHNTNMVTIDDNVAYRTKGHCFVTETGKEVLNTFSNNLGARTSNLEFGFGESDAQSDNPGVFQGAATFWIRIMKNNFVGNVAAGCVSMGFWFEMKDVHGDQLSIESFKDNVAHSNFRGLVTYKKGWQPKTFAVIDNFKTYKNDEGIKFHISGNFVVKNSLLADNIIGVRYGVWNTGVLFENTRIVANSDDAELRLGHSCPITKHGIYASFNSVPARKGAVQLKNVSFEKFTCGRQTITSYWDSRQTRDMGVPITPTDVSFVNSDENTKPSFNCRLSHSDNLFMEDFDGTLGPSGTQGPGFIIRSNDHMKAFMPPGQCETIPYGGRCSEYCNDVCLRLVTVTPSGMGYEELVLTDGTTSHSFLPTRGGGRKNSRDGSFTVVLPAGTYTGHFVDSNGQVIMAPHVEIVAHGEPRCNNYVTDESITIPTATITGLPDRAKLRSAIKQRYLVAHGRTFGTRPAHQPIWAHLNRWDLNKVDCGSHTYKNL